MLAFLVALVQGGSQALSRSLFARMIPRHKSSEFFGFFSVFEKFAGIAGPAIFAVSITLFGNSRVAILSVILFFIAGAAVLTRVNVREGEAQAAAGSVQAHENRRRRAAAASSGAALVGAWRGEGHEVQRADASRAGVADDVQWTPETGAASWAGVRSSTPARSSTSPARVSPTSAGRLRESALSSTAA